jgi:RNA polymerase sigma factor (sigma-70 family)
VNTALALVSSPTIREAAIRNTMEVARRDDPDADDVRRAAAGDMRAFEALYRRHNARVHGALWRLAGGVEARAQELTQDAFVRAWQKLDSFRYESSFSTWLYRLAVNVALMDLRGRAGAEDQEIAHEFDDIASTGGRGISRDMGIDLEQLIAKLPPRARAVLVLHDIEGWKHEEIATELGMAVGSSKAQLHRARGLLRRGLGETS